MLRVAPRAELLAEIRSAAGLAGAAETPRQAIYLDQYLQHPDAGARSLLVEPEYVDRHFIEEFAAYYATKFHAPASKCTRIHVFACELSEGSLEGWVEEASRGLAARAELERRLSDDYLGFVVVRPLPFAPIGRSVLRPYRSMEHCRCYAPATTPHRVHVLGLELCVPALPFQQQDRAVGACATTAVWTALSRTLRADGGRSVTPRDVTEAATRYAVHQRAMPAEAGLTEEQIDAAMRAFHYESHHLTATNPELFRLCLKCYLSSGIPVLLKVSEPHGDLSRHALVLAGYRAAAAAQPLAYRISETRYLRTEDIEKVYVHDDRLGPYARMIWFAQSDGKMPRLRYEPYGPHFLDFDEDMLVWSAIVPLYRKLRLTAEDLVRSACELIPAVSVVTRTRDNLFTDLRFSLGGLYLSEMLVGDLAPTRKLILLKSTRLPRYVGIIRFRRDDEWLLDVVCDTTDIYRETPKHGAIAAIVARERETGELLARTLAEQHAVRPQIC